MTVTVAIVACSVGAVWLTRDWPPSAWVIAVWRRNKPIATAYVRDAPATVVHLAILLVTTTIYNGSGALAQEILLRERSTNLHHLSRDPVNVLVSSAFWVGDLDQLLPKFVLFLAILVPLERWLGTARFLLAFWTGHVGSTLLVAIGLRLLLVDGHVASSVTREIDVGVSYGAYCCCALFTYRLTGRWRVLWAAGWLGFGVVMVLISGTFTDYGHLITILIGFALHPLATSATARDRAALPLWRPSPLPLPDSAPA